MNMRLDATHAPTLRSWVTGANDPGGDFPIQNLPLGCFRRPGESARIGIAIGPHLLDLAACAGAGLLDDALATVVTAPTLNAVLALGRPALSRLRAQASALLAADAPARPELLVAQEAVELLLPAQVGDYSDGYASIEHATNVGRLFRPDNPLLPNYKHLPIAYHGRASSLVASGTPVRRPWGQRCSGEGPPEFAPSMMLDYELELGALIGPGNALGAPVPLASAEAQIAGLCLVNDWSARDIQRWEYQPLGPFLSKSFQTSLGPWLVTLDALAPFRVPARPRAPDDPPLLPYLDDAADRAGGGFAITVEASLCSAQMRAGGMPPLRLSRASFAGMYWTLAQLVAHQTSNGCNLRPGDLIASGTISGPTPGSQGCLLELTHSGSVPLELPTGEQRRALADGDELTLRAWCEREGFARIGFGSCKGVVLATDRAV
jgi:fumarylacetoacetase